MSRDWTFAERGYKRLEDHEVVQPTDRMQSGSMLVTLHPESKFIGQTVKQAGCRFYRYDEVLHAAQRTPPVDSAGRPL